MTAPAPAGQFRVLGPLEAELAGEPQPLGGPKQRAVLALLLLHRNRVVPAAAIGDAVWGDDRTGTFQASLHVAVSGLRRSLRDITATGAAVLETAAPGYRFRVAAECLDLDLFRAARDRAADGVRAGHPELASEACRAALGLWRGRPLSDLSDFGFADEFAVAMEEEFLATLQLRIDADLQLGRDDALVGELVDLTRRYPLREHFWAQLATAYYHLDRQADALGCLRDLRETLDQELGIDPSPGVQELELAILRQDLPAPATDRSRGAELAETVAEADVVTYGWLVTPWGSAYPITERGIQLGRSADNDLTLADDRVSRQHLLISADDDGLRVTDLRSTNGTFVNGVRLTTGDHELRAGDTIAVGRAVFTVRGSA